MRGERVQTSVTLYNDGCPVNIVDVYENRLMIGYYLAQLFRFLFSIFLKLFYFFCCQFIYFQ